MPRITAGEHLFDWEITHRVLTFYKDRTHCCPPKILVDLIPHLSLFLSISCAVLTLHSLAPPSKGQSEARWLQESWNSALLSVTELLLDPSHHWYLKLGYWTLPAWKAAVIQELLQQQPAHPAALGRTSPAIPAPLLHSAVKRPGEGFSWTHWGFSWWILSCVYISEQLLMPSWHKVNPQSLHRVTLPQPTWFHYFSSSWILSLGCSLGFKCWYFGRVASTVITSFVFLQPINFHWKQYLKKQTKKTPHRKEIPQNKPIPFPLAPAAQ